jgi:iron complex outermembrane receptor protein
MKRNTPCARLAGITAASIMVGLSSTAVAQQGEPTLDTIVVTAQRIKDELEREQALTPGGVSVVDGAALYQRNVTNLADMLRYVPGVWSDSSSGSDELFFSSRGSNLDATDYDKNGIKLLQDGLPVTTADGNNHNRMVDPLSNRYAVIARGANALTYGASTLGGAIDFISPTAHDTPPLGLSVNGGSHGSLNARATAGLASGAFDGLATLETKAWDGYRDHNTQQRLGGYANGGWQLSDSVTARVYAAYVDNDEELPGALTRAEVDADAEQASPNAVVGNFQKNVKTARIAAKTMWAIDDESSFEFGLSYEEQSLYHPIVQPIMVDFDGPGPDPAVEVFSLLVDTDHRNAGAMLRYKRQIGAHDLVAGVNYGDGNVEGGNYRNDGGRRNGLTEQVDNNSDSLEAFMVDRWRLGTAWTLVYGAQFVGAGRDVRTIDAASGSVRNPKDDYSAVNPRIGVIYAWNDRSELFASASRLFEAPTTFELEDDVRASNVTLDAMTGTVYEIGARGERPIGDGGRWHWDVAAFFAQIQDEILSVDDPLAPGNSLSTNVDDTIHAGIEALLGASFAISNAHRIEPLVSLTWNDFSFDSDPVYGDNELPAAPEYAARGEVLYRTVNGFYAGPTFDLVGERFADFSNTYKVDGYELLGLRAGYSSERWDVFAELRNLLDEDYIATVSARNTADADARVLYPGAPLSAYIGARIQF